MDKARFKAQYFRMIKDAGFAGVRINLHSFRHTTADKDYALADSWWQVLDWAVKNALQSDLMVILDMHEFGAMGNDPEGNKDKFLAFWRQVSQRFQDAPDNVLFEILNEPSRKLTPQMWNQYMREALAIIRKTNPVRTVIIGPANYNSIGHLGELALPEDDRNIIVTVHYYSPMDFTHQGAPGPVVRIKRASSGRAPTRRKRLSKVTSRTPRSGQRSTTGLSFWGNSAFMTKRRWTRGCVI
jgi:endoglucanase